MHELFGTKHLILIGLSIILIGLLSYLSTKIKHKTLCKTLFYVGIVAEILKIFYFTITNESTLHGILPKSDLPFHLCSIQIIFITIINFSKSEKVKKFLYSFMLPSCLIGGFAAILIATDSSRNGNFIITTEYFGYHIALVVFGIHLILSKEIKFEIKDYFNCLKFLLILFFFSTYINSIVYDGNDSINFMYVASPPQEGLPYLNENNGWLSYILRYASLIIVAITVCYIKPIISSIKKLNTSKQQ